MPRPQPAAADRLGDQGNQARDRGPPGRFAGAGILPTHAGLYAPPTRRRTGTTTEPDHSTTILDHSSYESQSESLCVRRRARQLYADGPTQAERDDQRRQPGLRLHDGRQHGQSGNRHEPLVQRHGRALDEHFAPKRDPHRLRHALQRRRADAERGSGDGREQGPRGERRHQHLADQHRREHRACQPPAILSTITSPRPA